MRLSLSSDSPSFADIVQQALLLRAEPLIVERDHAQARGPARNLLGPIQAGSASTSPRALGGTVAPFERRQSGKRLYNRFLLRGAPSSTIRRPRAAAAKSVLRGP